MSILALTAVLAALASTPPGASLEIEPLGTELGGSVEIPTLGTSDGETIYCVYSRNIDSIWIQATQDGAKTWSKPVCVMQLPSPRYITDANILVDGKRLTVFATHVLETADHPGKIAKSVFLRSDSVDGGLSWSAPEALPIKRQYVVGCIHAPVWLDGDTVVMGYSWDVPAEEHKPAADEGGMFLKSGVLISHDRGRTWTPGENVQLDIHPIGADEPALVRLRTGHLFMVARTSQPRPYETLSRDGGRTWDKPWPSKFRGYNSPTALLKLRDGTIVRAWDNSPSNRFPLVVALGADDAQTWSAPRTVTDPCTVPTADSHLTRPAILHSPKRLMVPWFSPGGSAPGRRTRSRSRLSREWLADARRQTKLPVVVAFGDSVTHGVRPGVAEHQTFRHILQDRLPEQGLHTEVVDAGIGSDTTASGLARLEQDVLSESPALVIVMFGMNDAAMVDAGPTARTEPRVPLESYRENLRTIVRTIEEKGGKVLLCTPTPMSRRYVYGNLGAYAREDDINFQLRHYARSVRELAAEEGIPLIDTFELFAASEDRLELIEDGCHPYAKGHAMIAEAILAAVEELLRTDLPALSADPK